MSDEALIVCVAPNGARKTQADHAALPITPDEIAETARACAAAGAAMIHLHVRDDDDAHVLDAGRYRAATQAIRDAVGDAMIVQVTTEAVGRYSTAEQMALVRDLRPEAASVALRELAPEEEDETVFAAFLSETPDVAFQHILYTPEEVARFAALQRRGIVAEEKPSVLFVLGRYGDGQSRPVDLLPYLDAALQGGLNARWAVCAFGPHEGACCLTAAALGGDARVGFENNLVLADGMAAPDNAALVSQVVTHAGSVGRRVATADEARALLGLTN